MITLRVGWRAAVRGALTWALLAPVTGFAVLRVSGVTHGWFLVACLAFTPYVAAAALLPLVVAAVGRRVVALPVAALTAVVLAAGVLPRAVGAAEGPAGGPELRVATANMQYGGSDPRALLALVRDRRVDLLALQEYTEPAGRALDAAGIADVLPYRVAYPVAEVGGSALYSRHPLTDAAYRPLPPHFGQAAATLRVPGGPDVLVESVHPCAPAGADLVPHWRTGLAAQPRATPTGPLRLLLGDFNATLDHAPMHRLLDSGYRDAAAVAGAGLRPSWPSDGPLPGVTIDHVLADRRIAILGASVHANPGSDHRAVFAALSLPTP